MKKFTPINTAVDIQKETYLKSKKDKIQLVLSAYIEEKSSKHITINITEDIMDTDDFNIWLDLDIFQAELLSIKLKKLVEDRKYFMSRILQNEEG
jgi:hypothetical protein